MKKVYGSLNSPLCWCVSITLPAESYTLITAGCEQLGSAKTLESFVDVFASDLGLTCAPKTPQDTIRCATCAGSEGNPGRKEKQAKNVCPAAVITASNIRPRLSRLRKVTFSPRAISLAMPLPMRRGYT